MHISLTDVLDNYVKNQVATGHYNNASEVIRDALRLKIEQDTLNRAKLEALRRDIQVGWDQLERGESVEYDLQKLLNILDRERTEAGND